jgi:hypothetical protein
MGLFSSKPKRNFLELLGLNIGSDLESQLVEQSNENDFVDYIADIKENFELFDNAKFRIFGQKKDLSGNTSFNLILENNGSSVTFGKIQEMVNTIASEYGKDRTGKTKWTNEDEDAISSYWEGREWIIDSKGKSFKEFEIGCIAINLHFDIEEGIDLSVLGANQLIN